MSLNYDTMKEKRNKEEGGSFKALYDERNLVSRGVFYLNVGTQSNIQLEMYLIFIE